jgi:hypothetical protein
MGWLGFVGHAEPVATIPAYELRKRSVCELPDGFRSPFLPVGWKRPVETGTAQAPIAAGGFAETDFSLTSVLLGAPSLAVINGRSYSEKEYLRLPKELQAKGKVQVVRIGDGLVVLQAGSQQLTIPQRRSDLPAKRPELEVISPDR